MKDRCKTCEWCVEERLTGDDIVSVGYLRCHKGPPTSEGFPKTHANERCGDWEGKKCGQGLVKSITMERLRWLSLK